MASQLVPILTNEATAARRQVYFHLVDATDGITAETGEAGGQPQISTNGGAWTNTGIGTLSAIGNGEYFAEVTQAATNITAGGRIKTRFKSAATAEARGDTLMIMGRDPFLAVVDANVTAMAANVLTATAINTGAITAAKFAAGAIDAAALAADAGTEIAAAVDSTLTAAHGSGAWTSSGAIVSGTADSGTTTTMVDAALTQADTDYWKGNVIRFTSGTISGQTRFITGFTPGSDTITFAPPTTQAVGTNTYEILPFGGLGALIDLRLNELIEDAFTGTPTLDSFIAQIMNKNSSLTFDPSSDSLEALRDRLDSTGPSSLANVFADQFLDRSILTHTAADTVGWALNFIDNISGVLTNVFGAIIQASGAADSGSTTTVVDADRTEADTDYWKGAWIQFVDGSIAGQVRLITGFNPATDTITFAPATTQAVTTNGYRIISAAAIDVRLWNGTAQNNLISGRVDASVGAMAANVITAASTAADYLAEINTEVDTALADIRLDELVQNAASPADPTADSFIDLMTSKNAGQTFDRSTDSLEAIKDSIGGAGLTAQDVRDAMKLAPTAGAPASGSVDEHLDDILADTAAIQPTVATNLDATVSSRATPAQVNTEVDTALADIRLDEVIQNAAAPITPTANSFWDRITSKDAGQTFDRATDSLEAITDAGGGGLTQQQVRDAMKLAPTAGAPAGGSVDEHLDDILADTAAIQPLVDVAVSTRATPAQVNTEVDTALVDIRLDELIQNAAAPATPTVDSFVDRMTSKNGAQTYDRSTDSLEAIVDGGGAGLTQQQVADALKLAPAAGAPAAGSVYAEIDTIMGPGFNAATDSLEEIRDEVDACCGTGGNGADVINVEGV